MTHLWILAIALVIALPAAVFSGEADVTVVDVSQIDKGIFNFDVTVRHDDTGWEHYADKWEVLTSDGEVVGTRTLHHPHVDEQPFTRSLSGVKLPGGLTEVIIRAHDSVHEYGGKMVTVKLP
jgi:hypothetical protein